MQPVARSVVSTLRRVAAALAPAGGKARTARRTVPRSVAVWVLLALCMCSFQARSLTLTLQDWMGAGEVQSTELEVMAVNNLCCGGFTDILKPSALPFSDSHSVSSGTAQAATRYSLSDDGFHVQDIEHTRPLRASALSGGRIIFSLDQDARYEISGIYGFVGNGWREIQLSAWLVDLTAGADLFTNRQNSTATADESFRLGEEGGDAANALSGARTGELVAGHTYRFTYMAAIGAGEPGDTNASAAGSIHLVFVPEAETGLQVLAGLAIIGLFRRSSSYC